MHELELRLMYVEQTLSGKKNVVTDTEWRSVMIM